MAAQIPARRTAQPQFAARIDPLWKSRKLRCAYLPGSMVPRDLAGSYHGADTTSTATLSTRRVGRVWDFGTGSSTSRIILPTGAINALGGITMVAFINPSTVAANSSICNTLGTAINGLQWRINTSGQLEIVCAGVAVLATDTVGLAANTWHAVAVRHLNGAGAVSTFAVNGRITASPTTDTTAAGNGVAYLGERYSGSSQPFQGQMAMFAQFDTMLSDAELVELTRNPWQIFAPVSRAGLGPTASGGTSYDVSAADSVTSSDSATQIATLPASGSDGVSASESSSQVAVMGGAATDAVSAGDAATQTLTIPVSGSDAASAADASTSAAATASSGADAVAASDAASNVATLPASATEAASAADAASNLATLPAAATDAVSAVDVGTNLAVFVRSASDVASASDVSASLGVFARQATDAANAADTAAQDSAAAASASDAIGAADASLIQSVLIGAAAESVALADAAALLAGIYNLSASELLALLDTAAVDGGVTYARAPGGPGPALIPPGTTRPPVISASRPGNINTRRPGNSSGRRS